MTCASGELPGIKIGNSWRFKHFADQRIHQDLDDGVKVNFGKFGDLLAYVKDIHGLVPEIV